MRKVIFLSLMMTVMLNLIAMSTSAEEKRNKDLIEMINAFIPANATLVSPEQPASTELLQLYDFDDDGSEEIIFTYELKAEEQPSPSQHGAIILKKVNDEWKKIWEAEIQGVGLDYSGLADITGDGVKEYLFGVRIGASAGNQLGIYQWQNNSLTMIAEVPYHKLELLSNNGIGLAVWQRYVADTYLVYVLTWDGQQLVFDEGLFSEYYPVIEKFHKDKLAQMNAWFYWYTLADAQIKANLLDKAEKSIQKGISIAEQSSLTYVVEDFRDLKERLENKKKTN
ncbi:hypothetical protein [Virgibacillus doumboii]|uniref:hypothetical protein n=1 Tax=Virgibacillus doumboii TaxID=2697503 RepID=UPI0013DFE45B|nr:hypothetical protein [Virgibacillus doumboii]